MQEYFIKNMKRRFKFKKEPFANIEKDIVKIARKYFNDAFVKGFPDCSCYLCYKMPYGGSYIDELLPIEFIAYTPYGKFTGRGDEEYQETAIKYLNELIALDYIELIKEED